MAERGVVASNLSFILLHYLSGLEFNVYLSCNINNKITIILLLFSRRSNFDAFAVTVTKLLIFNLGNVL